MSRGVSNDLVRRVAARLDDRSTYADAEQDIVDGALSEVIEAVLAELDLTGDRVVERAADAAAATGRAPISHDAMRAALTAVLAEWPAAAEPIYPEGWLHLHGKALSGLRHSHRLRPGEDPDSPDHFHNEAEAGPR